MGDDKNFNLPSSLGPILSPILHAFLEVSGRIGLSQYTGRQLNRAFFDGNSS